MKYFGFVWAGILVQDMEASISFYKEVLGLPFLGKGDDWAHFDAGNGGLLELFNGGKASPAPKGPDQQSIVLGLRVENLDSAIMELKQKGVQGFEDIGEAEGARWANFSDLEGNQLELKEMP
jgi:predicted enzyme related to lactoylglutathione lyase